MTPQLREGIVVRKPNQLLELLILAFEVIDLCAICLVGGIPRQTLLASFQELLAPAVVQVLVGAFSTTQFCDCAVVLQPLQHNADLLLGGILTPGLPANIANFRFWRYFLGYILLLVDRIFRPSSISYSNPLIYPANSETKQGQQMHCHPILAVI
jgi:hypothetical protein